MESDTIKGTPGPILLQAKRWEWRHVEGPVTIDVPMSSTLVGDVGNGESSPIVLNYAKDIDVLMHMGILTKALYSSSVYPKLEDKQVFSISSVLLNVEKSLITIIGNVLESV